MKKIALFGGSFDPVHTDHINIIKACKNELNFEQVWIVPAYVNPFKNVSSASVRQRLDMLNIAINDLDYVKIKTYEIFQKTLSYTYQTVIHYKEKYPDCSFSFIIGSDQLDNLEKWHQFDNLIKEINFIVFLRNKEFNKQVVNKYNLQCFEFNNNFLSSTKIRNLIDIKYQIKEVNDYINKNLIYIYERLEQRMDEKRYFHCLNVGQMAMELAMLNGYDLHKALIAGTLHDVAKRWTYEKMKKYLKENNKDLLNEPQPVWHSFVGAYHLKNDWLFDDAEIINSVFNHTVGSKNMSMLDIIVFCADKISIERDYQNVEKYRTLVKADLIGGFKELLKNQYEVAVKKHGVQKVGKKLKEAYDFWVLGEQK